MSALLSVADARKMIIDKFESVESELISLGDASGRVLSESIVSGIDLPLFPNSSMDGYAVRSIEVKGASIDEPVQLDVVADIPAGLVSQIPVGEGQTSRIMTGAP